MPFPTPNGYGIIQNPLVYSPFGEGNSPFVPTNFFLLMTGEGFLLMDGTSFLLMGT